VVHPFYTYLNSERTVFLTVVIVAAFASYGRRRHRSLYLSR
jgi:hypothetical protein